MEAQNHPESAKFVKMTREWFHACDERGLNLKDRLQYLVNMHDHLMTLYDPSVYPPPSTHVYRLPLPTFEMLLQTITCRIQL